MVNGYEGNPWTMSNNCFVSIPMIISLDTERTVLRPFVLVDAAQAFAWFSDPEVMRHIPRGPDHTLEETSARIGRYMAHQADHGFSKWVIIDRSSGKLMGDAGLHFLPDGQRVELGYRLARPYWGQGLATEVGQKWIEVAGDFISQSLLYAFAHPENASSLHIIRKLGFTYLQQETFYGWEVPLHVLAVPLNRQAVNPPQVAS